MTARHEFFSVDRTEGQSAVLEDDSGHSVTIRSDLLPSRPREGQVLRVEIDEKGKPQWATAVLDPAEASRRKVDATRRMDALRKKDKGGDIEL